MVRNLTTAGLAALAEDDARKCFYETKTYLQGPTKPKRRGLFGWLTRR